MPGVFSGLDTLISNLSSPQINLVMACFIGTSSSPHLTATLKHPDHHQAEPSLVVSKEIGVQMKFQPNIFPQKSIALTYGDVFLSSYLNSSSWMNYVHLWSHGADSRGR